MNGRRVAVLVVVALLAGCVADDPPAAKGAPPTTLGPVQSTASASAPAVVTVPPATTIVPPPGPLFGIAVFENRVSTIEAMETAAGSTFHLVRVFLRWEDDPGESDITAIQAGGRAIHLSLRPQRNDGSPIPWRDIADAEEGSPLHGEMMQWADTIVALGPDLRFTFNHEPETIDSASNGDALDYRAAWRRMVGLIRARGGEQTAMVWTVGREALDDPDGERWYPGDDVVDVIGADLYNWYSCRGAEGPWRSFASLIEPALDFARNRGKPLAVPEFATAADPNDPERRAGWMDAAVDTMIELANDPDEPVVLDFVVWFDVTAPGGTHPNCRWAHQTDQATSRAFSRMFRDLVGN